MQSRNLKTTNLPSACDQSVAFWLQAGSEHISEAVASKTTDVRRKSHVLEPARSLSCISYPRRLRIKRAPYMSLNVIRQSS